MTNKKTILLTIDSANPEDLKHHLKLIDKIDNLEGICRIILTVTRDPDIFLNNKKAADILNQINQIEKVSDIIMTPWISYLSRPFIDTSFNLTHQEILDLDVDTFSRSNSRMFDVLLQDQNQNVDNMYRIYDVYNFWMSYFSKNKVDFVIGEIELDSILGLMYQAAKNKRIPHIWSCMPTGLNDIGKQRWFVFNFMTNTAEDISYINSEENNSLKMFGDWEVEAQINEIKNRNILQKIFRPTKKIFKYLTSKGLIERLGNKKKLVTQISKPIYIKRIKEVIKYYDEISTNPDLTKKYILYSLHFEPEASSLPIARHHSNQLLNIRIISSALPQGWKLYVKDHPTQLNINTYSKLPFAYNSYGKNFLKYRNKDFYDYIKILENVELIKINAEQKTLVENAQIVTSISGSVILEASYFNKPCIMFNEKTLFSMFNNTWVVKDTQECKKAINQIMNTKDLKSNFQEILNKYSFQTKINESIFEILIKMIEHNCIINTEKIILPKKEKPIKQKKTKTSTI